MSWCEIFKTGTHKDSKGDERNWTVEDLNAIKKNFETKNPDVPICVGHPKSNTPAFGWVETLKVEKDKLYAKFKDVVPEFKEAVKKGLYKTRSISLTSDLIPRHIAFLGAQSPAVKGMEAFNFENNENDLIFEFENNEGEKMQEEIIKLQNEISAKNSRIETLEAEIKKQKEEKLKQEFEDFADSAVKAGNILPAHKNSVVNILQAVNDSNFNFEDESINAVEDFKNFISSIKQMDFEEVATPDKVKQKQIQEFSDPEEYKNAILEKQNEYLKKGIKLSINEALEKIKEGE